MAVISFIDNNYKYVKGYISRDYGDLAKEVEQIKDDLSYYIEQQDIIVGYKININNPLTELYGFNCYAVKFYIKNIDTLHSEKQFLLFDEMMLELKKAIECKKGYYNLRIPTNFVDLIKAFNHIFDKSIFCGGTVEQFIYGKEVPENNKNSLKIFEADAEYVNKNKKTLMEMTYDSFKTYQGQYHLSYVTDGLAGKIYENWIEQSLSNIGENKVIVVEHNEEPIGFVTIGEDDFAVEGILSSVSCVSRQLGAYKAMISYIINYANHNGKAFITSTQFDNFIVQGTWNGLGLKPFYSIYNFHVDTRNDK